MSDLGLDLERGLIEISREVKNDHGLPSATKSGRNHAIGLLPILIPPPGTLFNRRLQRLDKLAIIT